MTKPMNLCLLGSVLLFLGMLSACAGNASQDGDGPDDATGARNPMEEVLPPDVEILGSCTVYLSLGGCVLYYRPEGTAIYNEARVYDECRDIGDDIVWNEDWWSTENACPLEYDCKTSCPTAVLESACRFPYRVDFHYSSLSSTVDERRTGCDLSGGTFFEF